MTRDLRSAGVVPWLCVGLVAVCLSSPAVSSAHSCSEHYWYGMEWWTCDGDATYIVFGYIDKPGGTNDGYGICLYYVFYWGGERLRGDFISCYKETYTGHDFYQVFAGAGNDVVRLATTSIGGESCGTNCTITGQVPSGSYFEFHGEAGADCLYICDQASPSTSDCVDESAAAYGGDDSDKVYGSPYADILSGDGGTYDYVYGYAGDDEIYDTGGYGQLHGGDDCDFLSADTTAGGDYCYCEDNGGDRSGCERTDLLCDGCF